MRAGSALKDGEWDAKPESWGEKSSKLESWSSDLVESTEQHERHMGAVVGKNKTGPIHCQWIVDVPEKLDLFHDKYFPPRWKIRKEWNVCDTASALKSLPSLHSSTPHKCPSCHFPPFFGAFSALTPFTPGHDDLSSPPRLPHDLPRWGLEKVGAALRRRSGRSVGCSR